MHELVDKMYLDLKKEHTKEEVDALVRSYLEDKAILLFNNFSMKQLVPGFEGIRAMLGLID